ncbi:GIY-YIG nuclease family protein, partial [Mycobacterium sp. 1245801.1]|uniref:GIY-YIG nuclease family protein n=1 Tax=Mycobacterium sp. 1245801.1 TaxID=1834075 RepID=UPI0018D30DF5
MRTALYRFYSRSDRLLYVGITGDPSARFSAHRHTQPWWEEVATIRIERFPTRDEAARAEVVAIQTERPKYNRTHAITNTGTLRLR